MDYRKIIQNSNIMEWARQNWAYEQNECWNLGKVLMAGDILYV